MVHPIKVIEETQITKGTKYPAILSANCWIGALEVWASSTNRTICERVVFSPVCVAVTINNPFWFIEPPITPEPEK